MNREPIILITKPEKQLIEKDNLEIEINNYDNSHLYYKGFDLGTFKEIVNLRQENKQLKDKLSKIETLIINHNCDTGDIYYKYNSKFLKSELKQRILEIVYEVSK
jgi:hypothetical protein